MKLFTIGDSISQGFMSGAAARTDLSYSTLIARSMGLTPGADPAQANYLYPEWPMDGLPVNLEALSRRLMKRIGNHIDLWDWPRLMNTIRSYVDGVEDYYERGPGAVNRPSSSAAMFHNMAVQGFDVADAWLVTPEICQQFIEDEDKEHGKDNFGGVPSAFFYRTAMNVLNPQRDPAKESWSVLDWLDHHVRTEGVENLVLWLGANNALGTIVTLQVRASNDARVMNGEIPPLKSIMAQDDKYQIRKARQEHFNLWSPSDFAAEYETLLEKVDAIMQNNIYEDWKVFIGTVPAVTVAPLAKGVGDSYYIDDPFGVIGANAPHDLPVDADEDALVLPTGARYYKYYTYFLFDYEFAHGHDCKLTFPQVKAIDQYIAQYNQTIRNLSAAKNAANDGDRYHIVDVCKTLLEIAFKRNDGQPTYAFPQEMADFFPLVDTRYHHATHRGNLEQGGLFSLDGVHPSAIGHGVIANEFLNTMKQVRGAQNFAPLDWPAIYRSDTLYKKPISLMQSIRTKSEDVARFMLWLAKLKGRV